MAVDSEKALTLSAEDHADVFRQMLKLGENDGVIFAASDLHEDGITSLFHQIKPVLEGGMRTSDIVLLAGTDSEYESPTESIEKVKEIEERFSKERKTGVKRSKEERQEILIDAVEEILERKTERDAAWRAHIAEQMPGTTFLEVCGNHSNFEGFRDACKGVEATHDNYSFGFETGAIRLGKDGNNMILTTHTHHQLDDGGVVAEGFTDKQMGFLTFREMAEKAIKIAQTEVPYDTMYEAVAAGVKPFIPDLSPSAMTQFGKDLVNNPLAAIRGAIVSKVDGIITPRASLQEALQGLVDALRKPVSTSRKIHRELRYRAVLGSVYEQLQQPIEGEADIADEREELSEVEKTLETRLRKIERKLDELPEKHLSALEERGRRDAYLTEKTHLTRHLKGIQKMEDILEKEKAGKRDLSWLESEVLRVTIPGEDKPKVLTSEMMDQISHIYVGHTHNRQADVTITREHGAKSDKAQEGEALVSYTNTGSATEKILTGVAGNISRGLPVRIKLENVGAAFTVYDKDSGEVKEVVSIGDMIAKNPELYDTLVAEKIDKNKPKEEEQPERNYERELAEQRMAQLEAKRSFRKG